MNEETIMFGIIVMGGSLIDGALPFMDIVCIPIGLLIIWKGINED
jgi:type IV secretory pathway VirB2 component (pilin)